MQEPIQEINKMVSLPGGIWKEEEHYPFAQCINTLVIYSTSPYSKAFYYDSDDYPEMKVCGLVTYFFTKLVSTENKALSAILSDVRKEVVSLIREKVSYQSDNPLQVLVYEDLLMGNVNLLAESKGNSRVKPVIINPIKTSLLSTTIQWVFRLNVDKRIRTFRVICKDDEGKSLDIWEELTFKNIAEFKNKSLKPETTHHLTVVAVYKDGFESESDKGVSFKTLVLAPPHGISIEPVFHGGPTATVNWKYDGDDSDLSGFKIQLDGVDVAEEEASYRKTHISGLQPSTSYTIKVIAVYKDDQKTQCQVTYENDVLQCAEITDLELTRLRPLTLDVHWSLGEQTQSRPKHYQVFANDDLRIQNCKDMHAKLDQLEPGTKYSLRVRTCYGNDEELCLMSETFSYTTPTEDERTPKIEVSEVKQNSVVVQVSDPPFFRERARFHVRNIHLRKVRVRRTPEDGSNVSRFSHEEIWACSSDASKPQTQQVTLAGNIPGRRYRVKCEMEYNSTDILTNEVFFTSPNQKCIARALCSPYSIFLSCFTFCLLFLVLTCLYAPYHIHLENTNTEMHLVLTNAIVQCGTGNSRELEGINLKSLSKMNDSLVGDITAWLVRKEQLKLYSQIVGPFADYGVSSPNDHYKVLAGSKVISAVSLNGGTRDL
jgi:hypothetical protein